jgi:hypothetical protein
MARGLPVVVITAVAALMLGGCATNRTNGLGSGSAAPSAPSSTPATTPPVPSGSSRATAAPTRSQTVASGSGIEGITVVARGCPVLAGDGACDKPVAASLSILEEATGAEVAHVDSGSDGRFRTALAPGRYVVRPVKVNGVAPPKPFSIPVRVDVGHHATITVRFDIGPHVIAEHG